MKRDLIKCGEVLCRESARYALDQTTKEAFEAECLKALNKFLADHGPKWWEFWR